MELMPYEHKSKKGRHCTFYLKGCLVSEGFNLTQILSRHMSPKVRGLTQHGGLPGRLEESDPAGCDFVRDGRSMPLALTDYLGLIYYLMYMHKTPS